MTQWAIVRRLFPVSLVAATVAACAAEREEQPDPRSTLLVSADWLATNIEDPNLVILHVGDQEDYLSEHIPGAQYITRDQVSRPRSDDPGALVLELPDLAELEATLGKRGISDASKVVLYWGGEWVTPTTRVLLTLDWAGLGDRTVVLDGGLAAWKAAGHPVTDALPDAPTPERLTLHSRPELVVDAEWVRQHAGVAGYALVDARSNEFYSGEREREGKAGHIPGASNVPWTELVTDSLALEDSARLRAIFSAAGVGPGDTVVAYCHIGQYATMVILAARSLGHEVRLYDGSFQDWALRDLSLDTIAPEGGI